MFNAYRFYYEQHSGNEWISDMLCVWSEKPHRFSIENIFRININVQYAQMCLS